MKIEQIYTGCLAQGAYFIVSNGEAAVIDPLREVEPYIQKANKIGAKIKYVFETHFHADFVSGHLDLAEKQAQRLFMVLMRIQLSKPTLLRITRSFNWVRSR